MTAVVLFLRRYWLQIRSVLLKLAYVPAWLWWWETGSLWASIVLVITLFMLLALAVAAAVREGKPI